MCVCVCVFLYVGLSELLCVNADTNRRCVLTPHNLCLSVRCWPEANGPCALCMAGRAALFTPTV